MILRRGFSANIAKPHLPSFQRPFRHNHSNATRSPSNSDALFSYTSGRWLWNEKGQLEARYRRFDVARLQEAACRAVGAEKCTFVQKIGEGNYNKAYRLTMENGQTVIAKIAHPNAGPAGFTTASEVATMEFVRTVLGLPVPKVLAWNANDQNAVEAEYILMEEAKGSRLHEVWEKLPLAKKRDIIFRIIDVESKMLSISFTKLGSLYFTESGIPRCEPAIITDGPPEVSDHIRSRFCIGPTVQREFWEKERSQMHEYQGPYSATEYLESVARGGIDWIKTHADPNKPMVNPWQYTSPEQNSPEAHISSLLKFVSVIPYIVPKDWELVSARLWHPDFHAGNIYINDEGQISSIIDWQGAWTTPVFIGANPPLLLDYSVEMLMNLPDDFKQLDEVTKDRLRHQVAQSILIYSYETETAEKNPLMNKMMRYPHGQTLKQLEAFAGGTWDNCLYPFQECLIRVEREWEHFDTNVPCPFEFSAEEVQKHHEQVGAFNQNREFWKRMDGILTDEGYTSNETFSQAMKILEEQQPAFEQAKTQ